MIKCNSNPLNSVCAAHSDLHSVAFLRLLPLPLPVPQLGLRLLQAPLGDFPECLDPVPLQLEVAPLLPLSVQLLSEADDVVLQLEVHTQSGQLEIRSLLCSGSSTSHIIMLCLHRANLANT